MSHAPLLSRLQHLILRWMSPGQKPRGYRGKELLHKILNVHMRSCLIAASIISSLQSGLFAQICW
jgi:hypothetical protein